MKIGIMTWFYGDNYGARAHSYALQQTIIGMGHECTMIAIYPEKLLEMNVRMNLNYKNRKKHPVLAARCLLRNYRFSKARKEMYHISPRVTSAEEIDTLGFDLIILGSDEVFKVGHPYFSKLFYGVGLKTPTITYAPSSGQTADDYNLPDDIKKAVMKIKAISVRDKHTYELLKKNTGREAQIVLDPTLIYDFNDFVVDFPEEKYVLVYSFDTLDEYAEKVREYAYINKLKIISIGRFCKWADKSYDAIDIYGWIGAFRKAEMVVTDSFHGTVFAIKNMKRFVLLGREDKINKINDLMLECGIDLTFYDNQESIQSYLDKPFYYDEITRLLLVKKNQSIHYLENAIAKVEKEK